MIDVSLIIPAIRTHNWTSLYRSIFSACKYYTFELVFISPFDLPKELKNHEDIFHIKDFGSPSRCTQLGVSEAQGKYILNCVDDGIFFPHSIDTAMDHIIPLNFMDVINLRYREHSTGDGMELPLEFWNARYHENLRLLGIKEEYKISLHFLMRREYYMYLGGVDCQFEYVNHGAHDLMFRVQEDGGIIYNSWLEGMNCTHMPERTGDHGPIHDAQINHDEPLFNRIYSEPNAASKRIKLPYNNWKQARTIWARRFGEGTLPEKYEDLLK